MENAKIIKPNIIRFFKIEVIVEANNISTAEGFLDSITQHFGSSTELWRGKETNELSKKEIMDFFDYDEETYKEMVELN